MSMVEDGAALCVAGNHESKLVRKLKGRNVQVSHGLAESLEQLENESASFREGAATFLDGLISHYVLDGGELVVAHAGMKVEYQGRASARVRDFCLYGETTGETDEWGLPVRSNWAADYRGRAMVVYGHTPVAEPAWLNRTINVDTGCVFGGKLTALRYPEQELVSVPAGRVYYEPVKPLSEPDQADGTPASGEGRAANLLDIDDVIGKRIVETRLRGNITVREENAAAALEVMSRFALDPRWLVYLPPTISPGDTSRLPDLLEHPAEVFSYYRNNGVSRVVCEEKHMGSRAIVVVAQDAAVIERRFGIAGEGIGACYTRTGRRFFEDRDLESQLLERIRSALTAAGLWGRTEHRLGGAGLRAHALVGEGAGTVAGAIRSGWRGGAGESGGGEITAQTDGKPWHRRRWGPAWHRRAAPPGRTLQRRLRPVLLAGNIPGRYAAGAVPSAGERRSRAYG